MTCSIRGVPRMIQTKVLIMYLSGANLDIDPNDMIRPNGSEITSVNENSKSDT